MGRGISPSALRNRKYRALKRIAGDMKAEGIPCEYKDLEVRGDHFVAYFAGVGPASNGESCHWPVLRFNPSNRPEASRKRPGDVDYTNFHTRDKGEWEVGVKRVKDEMLNTRLQNLSSRVKPSIAVSLKWESDYSSVEKQWACVLETEDNNYPHWIKFYGETAEEAIETMEGYLRGKVDDHAENKRDPAAFLR